VPLKPGENTILKLAPTVYKSLKRYLEGEKLEPVTKKVVFRVEQISFGDGSGYTASGGAFPRPGDVSAKQPAPLLPLEQVGGHKRQAFYRAQSEMPFRVTAVRGLDDDDWEQDMEIEVQNTSDRTVYAVSVIISFPDIPKRIDAGGIERTTLTDAVYGRRDFLFHHGELAKDEDVPIKPGEKAVLKLEAAEYKGLKGYLEKENLASVVKKLFLRVDYINFGDGSGYAAGGIPFPRRPGAD
jgi:hypothetical protein